MGDSSLLRDEAAMDVGFSYIHAEAAGAVRTALVSAENLHLSLKSGLSLEEQALTHTRSPKDTQNTRYRGLLEKNPVGLI